MQFARNKYKWIRYATSVIVGAQGVLSTTQDSPDHVIHNNDLPSASIDIYYHTSDDERNRMYPINPLMERTTVTSSDVATRKNEFCHLVRARDGLCVLTRMDTDDAVHLVQHSKGDDVRLHSLHLSVTTQCAQCIEQYTRHRSRDLMENDVVTDIDDVRNGILLNPVAHHTFGKDFAFLIVCLV